MAYMNQRRPGYTLIELLIVVILIGLITALAAPQISQSMANNAVSEAASEVMVSFRAARVNAARTGRAYRVFVSTTAGQQIVRVDQGANNRCSSLPACNNTPPNYGGAGCGVYSPVLNMNLDPYDRRNVRIQAINLNGATPNEANVCINPSGRVFWFSGGTWQRLSTYMEISIDRTGAGGVRLGVLRTVAVDSHGTPRLVI